MTNKELKVIEDLYINCQYFLSNLVLSRSHNRHRNSVDVRNRIILDYIICKHFSIDYKILDSILLCTPDNILRSLYLYVYYDRFTNFEERWDDAFKEYLNRRSFRPGSISLFPYNCFDVNENNGNTYFIAPDDWLDSEIICEHVESIFTRKCISETTQNSKVTEVFFRSYLEWSYGSIYTRLDNIQKIYPDSTISIIFKKDEIDACYAAITQCNVSYFIIIHQSGNWIMATFAPRKIYDNNWETPPQVLLLTRDGINGHILFDHTMKSLVPASYLQLQTIEERMKSAGQWLQDHYDKINDTAYSTKALAWADDFQQNLLIPRIKAYIQGFIDRDYLDNLLNWRKAKRSVSPLILIIAITIRCNLFEYNCNEALPKTLHINDMYWFANTDQLDDWKPGCSDTTLNDYGENKIAEYNWKFWETLFPSITSKELSKKIAENKFKKDTKRDIVRVMMEIEDSKREIFICSKYPQIEMK